LTSAVIVLALDTATAATTAAIQGDGLEVSRTIIDPHRHVESLPSLIDDVLREAGVAASEIDLIGCGVGPGPFTGLRVAISTATAMSEALDIPVVGVCTHDAIARRALAGASQPLPIAVVTRARRVESFWSTFDRAGLRTAGPLALTNEAVSTMTADGEPRIWAGDAAESLKPDAQECLLGPAHPDARDLAALILERVESGEPLPEVTESAELEPATARGDTTEQWLLQRLAHGRVLLPARPLYLRRPDAVEPVL